MDEEYIIPGSNELIDHSPSDTETVVPGSNQLFDGDGSPGPSPGGGGRRTVIVACG